MRPPWPSDPPPGPFQREFWRSPLRGPWLSSLLGSLLLPLILICAITGFLSHLAYHPELGENDVFGQKGLFGIDFYWIGFPTGPAWIYALTQGLHVISGVVAIPILLAKLWSVMPKLFEWPPLRSPAHLLDRISLLMLVGGSIFVFFTGILNIQNWLPWPFNFVAAHYFGALIFLAGLGLHLVTKIPIALEQFRKRGVVAPLREGIEEMEPEPPEPDTTAPAAPADPTISRRGLIATVGAGSLGMAIIAGGQTIGGPFRNLALLAPRGPDGGSGPNSFPINKTFDAVGITQEEISPSWRLVLDGPTRVELSREQLLALDLQTESLPIACVEGWSTTQEWTGVRLRDLAALTGLDSPGVTTNESLQQDGAFRQATLTADQAGDDRTLLALMVNGVDLSEDHGYPARIIAPAVPGVHCTKWISAIRFDVGES